MALATKAPRIPGLEAPRFPGLEAPPRQACSAAEGLLSPGKGSNFLSGATLGTCVLGLGCWLWKLLSQNTGFSDKVTTGLHRSLGG